MKNEKYIKPNKLLFDVNESAISKIIKKFRDTGTGTTLHSGGIPGENIKSAKGFERGQIYSRISY